MLWESFKYEVWWVAHMVPRLRFCKARWYCARLVVAYPMLRPTKCRKHDREDLLRWWAENWHKVPLTPWPREGDR